MITQLIKSVTKEVIKVTRPVLSKVKEHTTSGTTKDVDYVTSSSTMYISWDGNFVSTSAPVTTFNVYIGTSPEGMWRRSVG